MNWSKYQEDIFENVLHNNSNIAISAVAGSGKTTTLVEVVKNLKNDTLFCAFNVHIAKTLAEKIGDVADAKTIHSAGMALLTRKRKVKVDNKKYYNIIRDIAKTSFHKSTLFPAVKVIKNIVSMTMKTLTKSEDFEKMLLTYGFISDITQLIKRIDSGNIETLIKIIKPIVYKTIDAGIAQFEEDGTIDFDDMLFLPVHYELTGRYGNVLVDEAQDLNAAQMSLVLQLGNGRVISVGDEYQSINGFAGALPDSLPVLIKNTNAIVLPLSVCYRCPTSHIDLAQTIVPHIEPKENAISGEVYKIKTEEISELVESGDLIICRRNAPLLKLAFQLIAHGRQARVRGRDFAVDLSNLVDTISNYDTIAGKYSVGFFSNLSSYYYDKSQILANIDGNEQAIEALWDKVTCIEVIAQNTNFNSADELKYAVNRLFDDETSAIYLSSVHRAKGLEADRVFILQYDKIRISYKGQSVWQQQQEANLEYVALTRAKETLFLVND